MKKSLLIFLMMILCVQFCSAQEITFTETVYNFGVRDEEDGAFYHDFYFTNSGKKELVIKRVIPGPGCTASGWKSSYKPGERGFVRITYHPRERVREHLDITSQVATNIGGTPYGLTLIGNVNLAKHIPADYFLIDKGKKKEVIVREQKDDFELILKRYVEDLVNTTTDINGGIRAAHSYTRTMRKDGSWPYLDYENQYVTDWEPLYHLVQLLRMSFAYSIPSSDFYGNDILYNAIMQGLKFWYQKNPLSANWYANQISAPDYVLRILAVMEFGPKTTDPKIKKSLLERINNSDPRSQPTSGKVKLGMIHLLRGCLLKDDAIVSFSSSQLYEPIKISEKEGIQKDLSYLDHGRQLYIGGYGYYLIEGIVNRFSLFEGTKYAMPQEKMTLLSDYIRGTYLNTFRSCYIDYSVLGRSIAIENSLLNKNEKLLNNLIRYDEEHVSEYQGILSRMTTKNASYTRDNRNQMFPCADYMLHNRKNYDFSIRCVSTRTIHDEVANGEGLLSTYLAEGANNIRVYGDEYYNIFPVWEWDKIPGTTTPEGEVRNMYVENGECGHTSFVGGVSDGRYGVMTYLMDDHGVKAHKGWFLFDDEVVCLGSGIENNSGRALNTSINQCHLRGDVYMNSKHLNNIKGKGEAEMLFKGFVWHNNIAYYFPNSTKICLKTANQKGSWNRINYNLSSNEISLPVFNLYIEHGLSKQTNSYEYVVIPGKTLRQTKRYNKSNIQIVSNTESLQAVYHKKLDVLQAIFYDEGTIKIKGRGITVKHPCTLLVTGFRSSQPRITITDPTQERDLNVECVITE